MSGVGNFIQERKGESRAPGALRIDRLVLLAGAVRPSDLTRAIGRAILDLPITPSRSLLGEWCDQAEALAASTGSSSLSVEVVLDPTTGAPSTPSTDGGIQLHVRRDETSFRGTGGALRDIASSMGPDGVLLVANAGQILTRPLDELVARLAGAHADIALVAHQDGTPSGLMLLTTRALQDVNPVGFVDFKEQVLPALRDRFDIRAVRFDTATGYPVRTLDSYIRALRERHAALRAGAPGWAPAFGICEQGAIVDPSARLHDAVLLAGARVEAGAVVVRSVVGPDAVVARGQVVVDSVVSRAAGRLGRTA